MCSSSSSATATPRKAPRPRASPRSTARTSRCGGSWCARRGSRWSELLHLQVVLHLLHAFDLARHRGGLRALGFRLHRPGEVHHAVLGRDADVHHLERGLVVDGLLHPHGSGRVVEKRGAAWRGAAGKAEERGSDDECEAMLELAHFTSLVRATPARNTAAGHLQPRKNCTLGPDPLFAPLVCLGRATLSYRGNSFASSARLGGQTPIFDFSWLGADPDFLLGS